MNPESIALVQQSFAKVAPIAPQAADIFYGRLFEVAPQVRAMFPDDMAEQKRKLMTTLGVVVNGLTRLDDILPAVRSLARKHVSYGAVPAHYGMVGETLLFTLETGLGEEWSADLHDAWTEAYTILSTAMIEAAESADQ
ncbi:hemin receptor [Altererythrobacter salegens]|uniref:Hemin receptor n=1 Tax=Croceibacterium salegens TaxID=1737568 RepID=A0A6I4T170_9SPHN|nr:globin family protein [Croceibacterium salegens]MXO61007.1 hemin receptor [Croceibacterium salegens]